MSLSKRAAKDAQWLQYKPMIQQMIVDDKAQEEIRQSLEDNGFRVTKHQLEYKLRIWDIRKRLPKTRSEAVWQYTDARLLKREAEGKSSEVIIDGKIVSSDKVRKERNRRQRSTLARYTQPIQTPQTPEEMRISICTPPPMPMQFAWPESLPWLQFEAKLLEMLYFPAARGSKRNAIQQSAKPLEPGFLRSLGLSNANPVKNVALLAAELGSFMPETQEGDNINRAQLILQGSSNEASHEYVKTMLYRLSNNFDDREMDRHEDIHAWNQSLELLQTSGITSIPLQLSETTDVTVAAVVEKLFRSCLRVLIWHEAWDTTLCHQTQRLTAWLLASGHKPNSKLMIAGELMIPIQAAVKYQAYELAQQLLESGTEGLSSPEVSKHVLFDVLGGLRDCLYELDSEDVAEAMKMKALGLVKRLIDMGTSPNEILGDDNPSALMIAIDCHSIYLVEILVQKGADLLHRSRCDRYRLSWFNETQGVLGYAAEISPQREALNMVRYLIEQVQLLYPSKPLLDFITTDAIFAAAINGHNEILILLHEHGSNISAAEHRGFSALHCAAYMGHLDTCKLLLEHGALVDGPHYSRQPPSPLVLASLKRHFEVVELLQKHGADPSLGVFIKKKNDWDNYFLRSYDGPSLRNLEDGFSPFILDSEVAAVFGKEDCRGLYQYLVRIGVTLPEQLLYNAIYQGDVALVNLALASPSANPNWRGPDGRTCLQAALDARYRASCENWNLKGESAEIATALLKAGAVLFGGELQQAVLLESRSLVEEIIQRDPGGFAEQQCFMSVLETAFLMYSSVMVEWALARDPHAYTPEVLCAAVRFTVKHGNLDILRRLLGNRQHSKKPHLLERLAIAIAAYNNEPDILNTLCKILQVTTSASMPTDGGSSQLGIRSREYELRHTLRDGRHFFCGGNYTLADVSPLSMALESPQCLENLLDRGCCPDQYTMVRAVECDDLQVLKRLAAMPRVELSQAFIEEVPLVCAVKKGKLSMAAVLLDAGEDVNVASRGHRGRSPLQAAVEIGGLEMINLCLEAGANANGPASHKRGATALQLAAIQGFLGIAKTLIDRGADVNASRAKVRGRTALEGAAEHGRIDMIHFLLDQGARTDGDGQVQYLRAIKLAEEEGHLVAAKMLRGYRDWTADDHRLWDRLQSLQEELEDSMGIDEEWWDHAQEDDFADKVYSEDTKTKSG
ncbi:Putative ankyrin repeat-containing domain superfamily [Colletotrichum destructivum]|uniref:Ankyrin repeat-containing domain superfamily n=1 Tax=Colletotrichum destructivum TaxID=34406 RepID=A0AAX4II32_9PEZI|nr:Putative ankyrin repeat-containing domain superfamily [Colletotrichum destructivum]